MSRTRVIVGMVAVAGGVLALAIALASGRGASPGRASGSFAWLHPTAPPAAWKTSRLPSGAILAYPPGWTAIKTDRGTASVALLASGQRIDAYLNVTPRQGAETLANWRRFRTAHNRREGDRLVRLVAATEGASFRAGHGSCVIDTYTTSQASYREIACLVSAAGASAVVVAAAPSTMWDGHASELQRAVSSFSA